METNTTQRKCLNFYCKKCNFKCSKQSNYNKHILTAKHEMETTETQKMPKNALLNLCDCGREYTSRSGLWKHKKKCDLIKGEEEQINGTDDIDYKSMFLKAMQQNNELMNIITSQAEKSEEMMGIMKDIIPKIGNNNNNTSNSNNQFNLQVFLNEDCKDALNFSEFIAQIQVSFEDLENQAENGYIKGISRLFIESLQELGQDKRPIHCSDKKRKTIYIKENDEWDKEGSLELLKKGISEVTKRTLQTLMKEKENNAEEYKDMDSEFSMKCLDIQRNLFPTVDRDATIGKVIEKITQSSGIV